MRKAGVLTEEELYTAAEPFRERFEVRIGPLYQLHAAELAKVVFVFTAQVLADMPAAMIAALVLESVKKLFKPGCPTVINLRVDEQPDGRTLVDKFAPTARPSLLVRSIRSRRLQLNHRPRTNSMPIKTSGGRSAERRGSAWQQWQRSAFVRVRGRSLGYVETA